jgi:cytidylate kinase
MIVTIDGPGGSGKSTAARRLADRLGFSFLDTGAMYRVVGLECLERHVDFSDAEQVAAVARGIDISFAGRKVLSNGKDVTDAIRTAEVTRAASVVALNPGVRTAMVELQQKLAAGLDVVTEGRDQGTVAFPHADHKFYFEAQPAKRAERRLNELAAQGKDVTYEDILEQLRERDRRDATRDVGPLKPAHDAVRIDTTELSIDEVVDLLERTVRGSRP